MSMARAPEAGPGAARSGNVVLVEIARLEKDGGAVWRRDVEWTPDGQSDIRRFEACARTRRRVPYVVSCPNSEDAEGG